MNKQILSEEFKRMQKLAGIINEVIDLKKYNVDEFSLRHADKDFFDPFIDAIYKDKTQLDPNKEEDWKKIIGMDEKALMDTYKLTPEMAKKVKDVIYKDIIDHAKKLINKEIAAGRGKEWDVNKLMNTFILTPDAAEEVKKWIDNDITKSIK